MFFLNVPIYSFNIKLNRLLELREFCESLCPITYRQVNKLLLTEEEWESLIKVTKILEPFAVQTKILQKEQLSLSDFFGGWATIKMAMSKLPDELLARNLLTKMRHREKDLFDNRVLNAAVFLDPRYQQFMPNAHKENAIEFLSQLHARLNSLKSNDLQHDADLSKNAELENFMASMMYENDAELQTNNDNEQTVEDNNDISAVLRNFIGVKKEPLNTSVFDFWEKNKHTHKMLYELASVVHSVPPTQTTVERAFSAMALILGPLRTWLSDLNLSNSLLIRLNRFVFDITDK